jgi:hypothetical protein
MAVWLLICLEKLLLGLRRTLAETGLPGANSMVDSTVAQNYIRPMNDSTITVLRQELLTTTANIPALEAQVTAAQERLRFATEKAAQIRVLLTMLEAEANEVTHSVAEAPRLSPSSRVSTPTPVRLGGTKADRMDAETTALLTMRGVVHRKDILAHLVEKGIMGSEKGPLAHLAAFLSDRKDKYESDGRGNFKLHRPVFEAGSNGAMLKNVTETPSTDEAAPDHSVTGHLGSTLGMSDEVEAGEAGSD